MGRKKLPILAIDDPKQRTVIICKKIYNILIFRLLLIKENLVSLKKRQN